jgi:hypothetical protein
MARTHDATLNILMNCLLTGIARDLPDYRGRQKTLSISNSAGNFDFDNRQMDFSREGVEAGIDWA